MKDVGLECLEFKGWEVGAARLTTWKAHDMYAYAYIHTCCFVYACKCVSTCLFARFVYV